VTTNAFNAAGGVSNLDAATTAATTAANNAHAEFMQMAMAAGLTEAQASALANQLGILDATQIDPKVFQLIAEDEGARLKLQQLQAQGIDPKTVTVSAVTDPATGAVKQMLSYIDASGATVQVDATTNDATGAIGKVESGSYDATVKAGADTTKAASQINQTAKDNYQGTIKVGADVNQAVNDTANIMRYINGLRPSVVVGATDQASSVINGIASRYYQATITVKADTSQYMSTFNSLPTSKTITQQVVSIPAPAPPPSLRTSQLGAAPRVATPTTSGAPVTINISGALDADSTARQISSILNGRATRIGSAQMGVSL
jgi:uncharacterized protein YdbL (DUF1318 family)